jgi:hypothetical protein
VGRRRRSESDLEYIISAFRELPLIAAVVAAPVFLVVFVWALPHLPWPASTPEHPNVGGVVAGALVNAFSPWIGWILAVGSLAAGLVGAVERWFDRRRVGRAPIARATTVGASGRVCPSCGSAMVLRTAKRGQNAGERFWGCSSYPGCRQTLPV